jgi:hyperosmotically inducible protein
MRQLEPGVGLGVPCAGAPTAGQDRRTLWAAPFLDGKRLKAPMHALSRLPLLFAATVLSAMFVGACDRTPQVSASLPAVADAASAAQVEDVDVTTGVKTALLRDEALKGLDITVVTMKGDVQLSGQLETQSQIDQALIAARQVGGVHSVHDSLSLRP